MQAFSNLWRIGFMAVAAMGIALSTLGGTAEAGGEPGDAPKVVPAIEPLDEMPGESELIDPREPTGGPEQEVVGMEPSVAPGGELSEERVPEEGPGIIVIDE